MQHKKPHATRHAAFWLMCGEFADVRRSNLTHRVLTDPQSTGGEHDVQHEALFCALLLWSLVVLVTEALLSRVLDRLRRPRPYDAVQLSLVVLVHNQAEMLEGFLRTLLDFRSRIQGRIAERVVVVDMGSTDDTVPILERMIRECAGLHLLVARMEPDDPWDGAMAIEASLGACQTPAVLMLDLREPVPIHTILASIEQTLLHQNSVQRLARG